MHPAISIGGGIFLCLLWTWLAWRKKRNLPFSIESLNRKSLLSSLNLVWMLFFIAIIVFEWMNFSKCLYYPTFDRDSVMGFDTLGYLIAQEHTIRNLSVFQEEINPGVHNPGSYISYAPLVQEAYALVYQWGAETSKSIPALMYISLLFTFYGFMKRCIGATGSIIATFFMMLTPEMIAFSSMSGTNVIHAIYASLGCMYGLACPRYRRRKILQGISLVECVAAGGEHLYTLRKRYFPCDSRHFHANPCHKKEKPVDRFPLLVPHYHCPFPRLENIPKTERDVHRKLRGSTFRF